MKTILDSPQLLDESLVTLTQACKLFCVPISMAACERYLRRGCRGAVLESVLVCGKRLTSSEAATRFIQAQMYVEADRPAPRKGTMKKAIAEASRKYDLAEPLQETSEN